VKTGTTVTWTNHDNFTHNVVLLELGNKNLGDMHPGGEKDTYTFDKPGVYHFRCTYHPQNMNGTVTVTSG
jgi:plastocyanin